MSINPIAFAITFAFCVNIAFAMFMGEFTFKEAVLITLKYTVVIALILGLSVGAGWIFAC